MFQTIIGLILLSFPFLSAINAEDKKTGILKSIAFIITIQLLIAIFTQIFGIFTYTLVLAINVIIASFILWYFPLKNIKIDWIFVLLLLISIASLYNVHYNYSGSYSNAETPEYQEIKNLRYPYPYFSDEWYAIALINDSIESNGTPTQNPLIKDKPLFLNFEIAFHSFLSEIILLLNLNPLTDYTKIAIFTGALIIALIYAFLRIHNITPLPSAIAALSALYITNGANLPGIWNLLPLTMGVISLLLGFCFIAINEKRMSLLMAFMTLLFYPPLVIFYTAALFFSVLSWNVLPVEKKRFFLDYALIIIFVGLTLLTLPVLNKTVIERNFHLLVVVDIILALFLIYLSNANISNNNLKKILYCAIAGWLYLCLLIFPLLPT